MVHIREFRSGVKSAESAFGASTISLAWARKIKAGETDEKKEDIPAIVSSQVAHARRLHWHGLHDLQRVGVEIKWRKPLHPWIKMPMSVEDEKIALDMLEYFAPSCSGAKDAERKHLVTVHKLTYGWSVQCELCGESHSTD